MAPHSSILAWKIPWMEEPGRLQSMGSLRVQHDWVTSLSLSCIGEGNGNPLQCSCLENLRDGEPGGLLSMGSHRVRHNWSDLAAAAAGYYFREGNGTPLQYSCLENPMVFISFLSVYFLPVYFLPSCLFFFVHLPLQNVSSLRAGPLSLLSFPQ